MGKQSEGKRIIEVAGLKNSAYVPVEKDGTVCYGGNQDWWESDDVMAEYGCGVIAMCDLELYLKLNFGLSLTSNIPVNITNGSIDYDTYKKYVDDRNSTTYVISNIVKGLTPFKMVSGIDKVFDKNRMSVSASWFGIQRRRTVADVICKMLNADFPVVAAYTTIINSLPKNILKSLKKPVTTYYYNSSKNEMVYRGSFSSHYFMITGFVKYYNGEKYDVYLRISSAGNECYIKYEDWIKKFSLISRILVIR